MDLNDLVRPNIRAMQAYSSARQEFKGAATVFLDANESAFSHAGLHRYPDPLAMAVKVALAAQKNVTPQQIFLGNGSDETIDVLIRIFCEPRLDNIIVLPPTYGMYEVSAATQDVAVRRVALTADFQPNVEAILAAADAHTKMLFLCSPNNPTGNRFDATLVRALATQFSGILVIDEAYIDFAEQPSHLAWLGEFPRLVISQTFSKAWGMAAIRLGIGFANTPIIDLMNKVKPPYNVNLLTQRAALRALQQPQRIAQEVATIQAQRTLLATALEALPSVRAVFPSDANFLLVRFDDASAMYAHLVAQGVVVRNRSNVLLCDNCLRITVGQAKENRALLTAMRLQ
jgi:histidinol-phosphate aminotransferase